MWRKVQTPNLSKEAWLTIAEKGAPDPIRRGVMKWAMRLAIMPEDKKSGLARKVAVFILYVRSHWLRMPPMMLARHLGTKALRKIGIG